MQGVEELARWTISPLHLCLRRCPRGERGAGGPREPPRQELWRLYGGSYTPTYQLRRRSLSPRSPPLSSLPAFFLFCPVLTWQRRGFRVQSAAAVASTSLPALRDRSVGVQPPLLVKHWGEGGCFQTLGWKVDKTPNIGGFQSITP